MYVCCTSSVYLPLRRMYPSLVATYLRLELIVSNVQHGEWRLFWGRVSEQLFTFY